MRINKIVLNYVKLPLKNIFTTSFGRIDSVHNIIVELHSGELVGYGEAPTIECPIYDYETAYTILEVIKKYLSKLVFKSEIASVDHIKVARNSFDWIRGHNFAKAAVEYALWDIYAKSVGKPLFKLINGVQSEVPIDSSLGIGSSTAELAKKIDQELKLGYRSIKLKIMPGKDLEVIRAVRDEFRDITLRVDANGAYSLEHKELFKQMDRFNLEMIEQPLHYDDIYFHSLLQKELRTPLCLDESIHLPLHAEAAIALKSCRVINIKPTRVGGLINSIKIHDMCADANIGVWCGGMAESGIGQGVKLALASLPNFRYPHDIDPSDRYFEEDLVAPEITLNQNGTIRVPAKPGFGYEVREDLVKKYCVKKIVLQE